MSLPATRSTKARPLFAIAGIPLAFASSYLVAVFFALSRGGAVGIAAFTVSVLVHELGHALVAKRYRLRPSIVLHAFGGWCSHDEPARRDHALQISFAGPFAGLVLGVVGAAGWRLGPFLPAPLQTFLWDLGWLGLFWSVVNLLPILPLDGGRIAENLLERRRSIEIPRRTARALGIAVALAVGIAGYRFGQLPVTGLLAWLGARNAWELGWVSSPVDLWRNRKVRPPTAGVVALSAALVVPAAASALGPHGARLADVLRLAGAGAQPWRFVTYALLAGPQLVWLASVVGCVVAGSAVERFRGARVLAAVAVGAAAVAGGVAWAGGGTDLEGPLPVALAVVVAWAGMGGPRWLVAVAAVASAVGWQAWDGAWAEAAADAAAALVGLAPLVDLRHPWEGLRQWWILRRAPPIRLT